MSTMKAQLAAVDQQAAARDLQFPGDQYFKVLQEFAAAIQDLNDGVELWVERGDIPEVIYLRVCPRYRRYESNIPFNFFLADEGLKTAGTVLKSPEALENYLVEVYKLPAFRDLLSSMSARSREDVVGVLRTSPDDPRMDHAEIFELSNADFVRLATARAGDAIELHARKQPRYYGGGLATPDAMLRHLRKFGWFGVRGYGVQVRNVRPSGDAQEYEIEGLVQPFGRVR